MKLTAELEHNVDISSSRVGEVLTELEATTLYNPRLHTLVHKASAPPAVLVACLRDQFTHLQGHYEREAARIAKIEQRLVVLTKGYEVRSHTLNSAIGALAKEELDKTIEYSCYIRLAHDEAAALPLRLESGQAAVLEAATKEKELQSRYRQLVGQIGDLRKILASAGVTA